MGEVCWDKRVEGYQFNFAVRYRVQREDGTEYLFDLYTVVITAKGTVDEKLAELAASSYNVETELPVEARAAFDCGESVDIANAYQSAKKHLEGRVQLWDWEEDVDLIGIAKVSFVV